MELNEKIKVGQKYDYGTKFYIKIMAIADGYVLARVKGCMPFAQSIKDFEKRNLVLLNETKNSK